jgi:hypothetical protein
LVKFVEPCKCRRMVLSSFFKNWIPGGGPSGLKTTIGAILIQKILKSCVSLLNETLFENHQSIRYVAEFGHEVKVQKISVPWVTRTVPNLSLHNLT